MVRRRQRLGGFALPAISPWVFLGGGAALLLLVLSRKGVSSTLSTLYGKAVTAGKEAAFAAALPPGPRSYAGQILAASFKYGVSPWLIAGVMYRESTGGRALRPPGPAGTGDFLARGPGSKWFKYANPATGLPPDGLGWGRGLMQIDYGVHNAWILSNDWQNPQVNIDYATSLLAAEQKYFAARPGGPVSIEPWRILRGYSAGGKLLVPPWQNYGVSPTLKSAPDPRPLSGTRLAEATLAAYNAGRGGVMQALAAGLSPARATSNADYGDWILSRVSVWMNAFG